MKCEKMRNQGMCLTFICMWGGENIEIFGQ